MLESFFIVFRESVELLLILSAALGYLQRIGRPELKRHVYAGLLIGAIITWTVLVFVLRDSGNDALRAGISIGLGIGALSVSTAVLSSAISIELHVHDVLQDYLESPSGVLLIAGFCAFSAVWESMEAAMFLQSVVDRTGMMHASIGAVAGLALTAGLSQIIRTIKSQFLWSAIFRVSTLLLFWIAIQVILDGVSKLLAIEVRQSDISAAPFLEMVTPGNETYWYLRAGLMVLPVVVVARSWWRDTRVPSSS